jgi:hypothetical protein
VERRKESPQKKIHLSNDSPLLSQEDDKGDRPFVRGLLGTDDDSGFSQIRRGIRNKDRHGLMIGLADQKKRRDA